MIHVVLYEPEIPANTGNIMRTCVAAGIKLHLIEPLGFSLDEKHLKRSGVNYIDKLNYEVYPDYKEFLSKNSGTFVFFTRYGNKPHSNLDYTKFDSDIYLVFGKESSGIPKDILKNHLNTCVRIPMSYNVRALNLSNTVAIGVYEILRQRGYDNLLFEEPHKSKTFISE